MKKKEIGLVAMFTVNYGNHLVNLALFQTLKNLGYPVTVIFSLGGGPDSHRENYKLFIDNPYKKTKLVWPDNKCQLIDLGNKFDIYIVGGDQQFRGCFVDRMDYYSCLYWVSSSKFKMSYGTSFGVERFESDCLLPPEIINGIVGKMKYLLNRFQAVSVRESSGIDLLKTSFGVQGTKVLDPVFLCDAEFYKEMSKAGKKRISGNTFVGGYILDMMPWKSELICRLSADICKNTNIVITDAAQEEQYQESEQLNVLADAKAEELLALIDNSEFFLTDSFHGMCMALILQKQFCVFYDEENERGWARIKELLRELDLYDRAVHDYETLLKRNLQNQKIDYDKISKKLARMREESLSFLKDTILTGENYQGQTGMFDEYVKDEINNSLRIPDNVIFVAWGAGECLKRNRNKDIIKKHISYVCDRNPDKWNKEIIPGVTCISPDRLSRIENVTVVITIDGREAVASVEKELTNMGIRQFAHITSFDIMKNITIE